jgi:hypothetical protein
VANRPIKKKVCCVNVWRVLKGETQIKNKKKLGRPRHG